jgi:hypothetical protein
VWGVLKRPHDCRFAPLFTGFVNRSRKSASSRAFYPTHGKNRSGERFSSLNGNNLDVIAHSAKSE